MFDYLLSVFRLPHDSPVEHIGVIRMLMGLLFIGLALYMSPAMFRGDEKGNNQKPKGAIFAWISSLRMGNDRSSCIAVTTRSPKRA